MGDFFGGGHLLSLVIASHVSGVAIQIIRNRPLFAGLLHCVRNDKGDEVPGKLNTLVIASKAVRRRVAIQ